MTRTLGSCFFLHVSKGQEVENYMCYVATREIAVTSKQDIPGYSGFYPRINGYIVNCIRKNTKVAENFVLRCLLHPIQRKSGMCY